MLVLSYNTTRPKLPVKHELLCRLPFCSDEPVRVPDVEVVYEKKPSQKQVAKAEEFKLPPSFYNYEDSPPCPGCRGCETDDTYHKGKGKKQVRSCVHCISRD